MKKFILALIFTLLLSQSVFADSLSQNSIPISYETGFMPGGAWEKDTGCEISDESTEVEYTPLLNSSGKKADKKSRKKTPSKYDPRNKSFITPLKDQGQSGLCWAFAGCSQIESSLIKLSKAPKDIDISEIQFAYFSYLLNREDLSFTQYCLSGSGSDNMKTLLMNGTGPICEREETAPDEIKDDFSLPDDWVVLSDYAFYCYWKVDFSDIDTAKKVIDTCGGVCAYYHSDEYHYIDHVNQKNDTSFYHDGCKKMPNHAVDIIGWDDNFPKEKFADTPPKNGAWLVKNSWGKSGYYTPDGSGFYWISYYEPSLSVIDGFAAGFKLSDICRDNVYEINSGSATLEHTLDQKSPVVPDSITVGDKRIKVEYISDEFFLNSQSLTDITIGKNVKAILPQTFKGCKNLTSVKFGKNLLYIGTDSFKGCRSLQSIRIPDKTCIIEDRAFKGCSNLTNVTIGKDTYRIGDQAFSGCKKLKSIRISATDLKYIGKKAFKGTPKSIKIKTKKRLKKLYKKMIKKAK